MDDSTKTILKIIVFLIVLSIVIWMILAATIYAGTKSVIGSVTDIFDNVF